jgi:4-hydroxy-tetrahydrodipicolinate synthase
MHNISDQLPAGLWPVMLTPFKDNNDLDIAGLQRLTDYYLDSGVNGMFANCLSSEMFQLTEAERLTITKTVIDRVDGKVPVVATGSFSYAAEDNIEFIKKIHDLGAAAVILITGVLANPDDDDAHLKRQVEAILEATGNIAFGFYECPMPYKRLLSPDMMHWLGQTGRFVYHKDTSCNSLQIRRKLKSIEGTVFGLYNADTPTALDSLDDGGRGISPISGNYYSELFRYLLDAYEAHGRTDALDAFHAHLVVMDRVVHEYYPWGAKMFLQQRGLNVSTATRIPTATMNFGDRQRHMAVMQAFRTLVAQYNITTVL